SSSGTQPSQRRSDSFGSGYQSDARSDPSGSTAENRSARPCDYRAGNGRTTAGLRFTAGIGIFLYVIHPTAIIHSRAKVDSSVSVGPYAVIDEGVEIGAECVVGPHVYVTGQTTIGARNRIFAGCVIGEAPQDLKYRNEPTGVSIGPDNV